MVLVTVVEVLSSVTVMLLSVFYSMLNISFVYFSAGFLVARCFQKPKTGDQRFW